MEITLWACGKKISYNIVVQSKPFDVREKIYNQKYAIKLVRQGLEFQRRETNAYW